MNNMNRILTFAKTYITTTETQYLIDRGINLYVDTEQVLIISIHQSTDMIASFILLSFC